MTRSLDPGKQARFWLIQLGGWSAYGLVSALGALPYRNAYPVLLYFLGTTAAAFLANLVLLGLSRRLAKDRVSWFRTLAIVVVCAYPLGIACSIFGAALEAAFGHLPADVPHRHSVAFVGFANAFSPTIMLVAWSALDRGARYWREVRQRERQLLLAESHAREAELRALRYQITPHFLFNTLNGISTLVGEGETRSARRVIALLADFLRSTLEPSSSGDVTMAKELAQVQQYVEIEQIRLGQRLSATIQCDSSVLDVPVPHLLLQPLVENAIRHGIARNPGGGTLSLTVNGVGDAVRIVIRNSVGGSSSGEPKAGGLGLANTTARLAARYRDRYRFAASGDPREGWRTLIEIPRHFAAEPLS